MRSELFILLGIFSIVTVLGIILRKPTKTTHKAGMKDHPIHTKPAFKFASVVIFSLIGLFAFGLLTA